MPVFDVSRARKSLLSKYEPRSYWSYKEGYRESFEKVLRNYVKYMQKTSYANFLVDFRLRRRECTLREVSDRFCVYENVDLPNLREWEKERLCANLDREIRHIAINSVDRPFGSAVKSVDVCGYRKYMNDKIRYARVLVSCEMEPCPENLENILRAVDLYIFTKVCLLDSAEKVVKKREHLDDAFRKIVLSSMPKNT